VSYVNVEPGVVIIPSREPQNGKEEPEMLRFKLCAAIVVATMLIAGVAVAGGTLDAVRERGVLIAGVNGGVFGFSMPDEKGEWKGLDVDTARAVAAAVFGDASKVEFAALTAVQ
jgi:general L-amino acid transport system substrate-binding protein